MIAPSNNCFRYTPSLLLLTYLATFSLTSVRPSVGQHAGQAAKMPAAMRSAVDRFEDEMLRRVRDDYLQLLKQKPLPNQKEKLIGLWNGSNIDDEYQGFWTYKRFEDGTYALRTIDINQAEKTHSTVFEKGTWFTQGRLLYELNNDRDAEMPLSVYAVDAVGDQEIRLRFVHEHERADDWMAIVDTPGEGTVPKVPAGFKTQVTPAKDKPSTAASQPAVATPKADAEVSKIGIEYLNNGAEVRFLPFGKIKSQPQMVWKIAVREPPVFTGTLQNEGILALTVGPAMTTPAEKRILLKANYNRLFQVLSRVGQPEEGTKFEPEAELNDSARFHLLVKGKGQELHVISELQFHSEHTYVFQAQAGSVAKATSLLDVSKTFEPLSAAPKANVPGEVVKGVNARIEEIRKLIADEKIEEFLRQMIPDADYQKLKADSRWEGIVWTFKKRKAAALLTSFERINWDQAEYKETNGTATLSFPVAPRTLVFENASGKWNIKN